MVETATGAQTAKGRRGRPPLHETGRKRAYFNARLSDHVKQALEESARAEGRSLSEEIEFRLWHSVQDQRALGGPRSAALFRAMGGIAGLEAGGLDWAADAGAYNTIHNRWLALLRQMAPPLSEQLKRLIAQGRKNVRRIEERETAPEERERLIRAVEKLATMLSLPPDVCEEFRAAAAAAREKWSAS